MAPALARAWSRERVCEALESQSDNLLLDDTALIVSELITNAIRAGCAYGQIELVIDQDYLRISVFDDAPGQVVPRHANPADTNGRGLAIIAALSRHWGVTVSSEGKTVWAELDLVRAEL
jgi:anti-sigma regulatory factor (Ser/Thr protein kinase)